MSFVADIRSRAQAAHREVHATARAERQACALFARGRVSFEDLRTAIRRAAVAEQEATELALVLTTLERLGDRT